jgi:hypothetical protein
MNGFPGTSAFILASCSPCIFKKAFAIRSCGLLMDIIFCGLYIFPYILYIMCRKFIIPNQPIALRNRSSALFTSTSAAPGELRKIEEKDLFSQQIGGQVF